MVRRAELYWLLLRDKFQFVELNIAYIAAWFSKEIRRPFLFWRRCSLWTKQITTLDFTRKWKPSRTNTGTGYCIRSRPKSSIIPTNTHDAGGHRNVYGGAGAWAGKGKGFHRKWCGTPTEHSLSRSIHLYGSVIQLSVYLYSNIQALDNKAPI